MKTGSWLRAFLFDFGGVLAEEGFRYGLYAIADRNGLNPDDFLRLATEVIYESGFITGDADETDYWAMLREKAGISGTDSKFRNEILDRFIIRPSMLELVGNLRGRGMRCVILSDQTCWLDILEQRYHFCRYFDAVINSFHAGKSKRDPSLFIETVDMLGLEPGQVMFIDDNEGNIARAASKGLQTHLFAEETGFRKALKAAGLPLLVPRGHFTEKEG